MNYTDFIAKKKSQSKDRSWGDINRKGQHFFHCEAATYMVQSDCDEKVFVLERLRLMENKGPLTHPSTVEKDSYHYRLGYYVVGRNGKMAGR